MNIHSVMNEKGCKEEEYFTWAWCFLMFCFRCFNTCSNQIHDLLNLFKKKRPYFILHLPEISTSPVLYTCLDLTLIKNLKGPRITIEQFFVLVTQAPFTRYWIWKQQQLSRLFLFLTKYLFVLSDLYYLRITE